MIFFFSHKTVSVASHITLEEVGADYEERPIDFISAEQRSESYLSINPKGRVPALSTEHGILTETPAILLYLAQRFPETGMAPLNDAFALAKVQELNAYLCATVHVAHAHRVRGARWVDEDSAIKAMQEKVPQTMSECFNLLEAEMFKGPWVMGEQYTICDPYLFTVSNWLEGDGVDLERFPHIAAHNQRMRERPAVARVAAIHSV
jgi:glutathione S-transferase